MLSQSFRSIWLWCALSVVTAGGACAVVVVVGAHDGSDGTSALAAEEKGNLIETGKSPNEATKKTPGESGGKEPTVGETSVKPATNSSANTTSVPAAVAIVVDGRTLPGTLSASSPDGRRLLPVVGIARALGDTIAVDARLRTVEIRRTTGQVAGFDANLGQVRENGFVVLTASATGDINFPLNDDELMLPIEILTALLDASLYVDERTGSIRITRGPVEANPVEATGKRAAWELFGAEYDYNFASSGTTADHHLTVRSAGRIGDGRFNLTTSSSGRIGDGFGLPSHVAFTFERPNGQQLTGGDIGVGSELPLMRSTVRGVSTQLMLGGKRVNVFGGRVASGDPGPSITDLIDTGYARPRERAYDTTVYGASVLLNSSPGAAHAHQQPQVTLGVMRFSSAHRRGELLTGNVQYMNKRGRVQADVAVGRFDATRNDATQPGGARGGGFGLAADATASFDLRDNFSLQGHYTYTNRNFASPQAGAYMPINSIGGGLIWRPKGWLNASLSHTNLTRPAGLFGGGRERTTSGSLSITPTNWLPRIFLSHTESKSSPVGRGAYTLLNVTKDYTKINLFANWTRVKALASSFATIQSGANLKLGRFNSLQVSQSFGSGGALNGTADWLSPSFSRSRFNFGAGFGYNAGRRSSPSTNQRLIANLRLPRETSMQITYLHHQTGSQLLINMRGNLFTRRRAEAAAGAPLAEMNSYGSYYGRVYQDVNLNGRYEPDIDRPQANVQVRIDGSRYVESDGAGRFRIDNVKTGDHVVYLDLSTVRADLTLLDEAQATATLQPNGDRSIDFRLVRTGRMTGTIWFDKNGNNRLDEEEQTLADVRIMTGSNRDTLTNLEGVFTIGDLPPGQHTVLVDEKTLPVNIRSVVGSLVIKVGAGSETGNVNFPLAPAPPQIKQF